MLVAVTSPQPVRYDNVFLANYAYINLVDRAITPAWRW